MLSRFLAALCHEILSSILERREFRGPAVFKTYLESVSAVSAEEFVADLRYAIQVINGTDFRNLPLRKSKLFRAVLDFFIYDFADSLSGQGSHFYLLSYEKRMEKAKELFPEDGHFASALRVLFAGNSYQELAQFFESFSKSILESDTVVVQVPRDISPELKMEVSRHLAEKYSGSFPILQINRQLIGGFRIFVSGKVSDFSWFSQVQKLNSLKN